MAAGTSPRLDARGIPTGHFFPAESTLLVQAGRSVVDGRIACLAAVQRDDAALVRSALDVGTLSGDCGYAGSGVVPSTGNLIERSVPSRDMATWVTSEVK